MYWNAATVAAIGAVRALQTAGTPVFFTVDAGPQVKAVCLPGSGDAVATRLAHTPGVKRVLRADLGQGARLVGAG